MTIQFTPRFIARAISMAGICILVITGFNRFNRSDPYFTLMTSQAIIEFGTINLDHYVHAVEPNPVVDKQWHLERNPANKKIFYRYPLGNSFIAVPFVAAARFFGMDMTLPAHDEPMQMFMALIVCLLVFYLVHQITLLLLEEWTALLTALFLTLGTTFLSTLGTAFWSFGFEVVFMLFILMHVLRSHLEVNHRMPAFWMGLALGATWICRPTAAPFIVVMLIWVAWQRPKLLNYFATGFAVPTLAFIIFSMMEFGTLLPKYYNPFDKSLWPNSTPITEGFPGLLFSPARGLFIFSPLLLISLSGFAFSRLRKNPLYLLLAAGFFLHVLALSRHHNWWGGWSFGPRLLTDALPILVVMLLLSLREWQTQEGKFRYRVVRTGYFFSGIFGVYVHTVVGMYNPAAITWNDLPNIDVEPQFYTWNWSYPQFFASESQNQLKQKEFDLQRTFTLLTAQLPENCAVIWSTPSFETRTVIGHIMNKKLPELKGIQFYNSVHETMKAGHKEFYFTDDIRYEVENSGAFDVKESGETMKLYQFLEKHKNHTVLLAVKDEGRNALSDSSMIHFRNLGSKIDSLKYRGSYFAVIDHGKLKAEGWSASEKIYYSDKESITKIDITSAGNPAGNYASIKLDKHEFSLNVRGFNVVVIDDNGKFIASVNFDTHNKDAQSQQLKFARLRK